MNFHRHTRFAPAIAAAIVFGAIAALWLSGNHSLYFAALKLWHIEAYRFPFLDGKFVIDQVQCLHRGIDVYANPNPCDPDEGHPFDYSPAWALLGFLPLGPQSIAAFGLISAGLFLASLVLLPPARDGKGALVVTAGALSTATVFAVERANNDIVIFALAAAGLALLCRAGSQRHGGYALVLVAGLLKYFPLAIMAIALNEPPRRFLALLAASLVIVGGFAVLTWPDLTRGLASVPLLSPFRTVFGASDLATGAIELGAPRLAGVALSLAAGALVLWAGIREGLFGGAGAAVATLRPDERTFLTAGGLVMLGCFFTAQNIDYRAIHLLLALPALVALRHAPAGLRYRALAGMALWLLWMDSVTTRLIALLQGRSGLLQLLVWGLREASWWWMAFMLVALLTALLKDTPIVSAVLRRFSSTPLAAASS